MSEATNIIFGDPVTPTATATQGTLEQRLLTISSANLTVLKPPFQSGRMKVQWSVSGRPQKQVSRMVDVGALVVAVHLDEK